jgi:hypothetical protein
MGFSASFAAKFKLYGKSITYSEGFHQKTTRFLWYTEVEEKTRRGRVSDED